MGRYTMPAEVDDLLLPVYNDILRSIKRMQSNLIELATQLAVTLVQGLHNRVRKVTKTYKEWYDHLQGEVGRKEEDEDQCLDVSPTMTMVCGALNARQDDGMGQSLVKF